MKLTEKQIEHYKRHIIIPEVGEDGQIKLLYSTAVVYCENTDSLRPLVYYLAALGIGKIFCYIDERSGADSLFSEVVDLNNDTSIDFLIEKNCTADYRIILGNFNYVKKVAERLSNEKFIPTIVSINGQWKGTLETFDNFKLFGEFINDLNKASNNGEICSAFLANAFSAALCSIEAAKLCLNIGNLQKDMLFYDLFKMEFTKSEGSINVYELLNDTNNGINKDISNAKVLIVGTGGLGSPAAYGMAMAGIGTLGLLDLDKVEVSNLNRQVLHSFSRIGMPKVKSAEFLLKKFNPNINIKTYITELTKDNAEEIFSEYHFIIAAVDNILTRYLINDTCFLLNKPYAEAGILRFDGTATTIIPLQGHCYRCLYPNVDIKSLASMGNGVLGPVPGVMGFIQAAEAMKYITGHGTTLKNKILLFDSLDIDFNIIEIFKNPDCPICGERQG